MSVVQTIANRVYADFLMPSRLGAYRALLEAALGSGYQFCTIGSFKATVGAEGPGRDTRRLILRHDVDTDPRTGRAMFEIETALGITSSWFFRLKTVDPDLMASIAAGGGEASYHYEELATIAKRRRLRTRDEAVGALPEARELFALNLGRLRAATGLPMTVVASHGDFINRRLGIANWEILSDRSFRASTGIEIEAYDAVLTESVAARYSDTLHPAYWVPDDPATSIKRGSSAIYLLVHPRHWRSSPRINAGDDLGRVFEYARYRLPVNRGRGST